MLWGGLSGCSSLRLRFTPLHTFSAVLCCPSLRCVLCLFWKIKAPASFPRLPWAPPALWIPQGVSMCVGKISWADRYKCSTFTLNLKRKAPGSKNLLPQQGYYSLRAPPRLPWEQLQMLTDAVIAIWHYKEWSQVACVSYCKEVPWMLKKK